MKNTLTVILITLVFCMDLAAQHQHFPGSSYEVDSRIAETDRERVLLAGEINESTVGQYLRLKLGSKMGEQGALAYDFHQKSGIGTHWVFRQTLHGLPIFMGKTKINISKQGRVMSIYDLSYNLPEIDDKTTVISEEKSKQLIQEALILEEGELLSEPEIVVYINEGIAVTGVKMDIGKQDHSGAHTYIVSEVGERLYETDIRRYCAPAVGDSLVSMKVFDPDPLTTAQRTYGAPYLDNDDQDSEVLNNERVLKTIRTKFENGQFILENDKLKISEFDPPVVYPVTSSQPSFDFTRSEQGFEDVNAYYHLSTYSDYVSSFDCVSEDLFAVQLQVDTHGANGDDNSFFQGIWPTMKLIFGEGFVDDAEDADVLVHELGHALSYYSNRNNNTGGNRKAIDEGIGDYFAASYSRFLSEFRWAFVFSWDGHNNFFAGRKANTDKTYPTDLTSDIWLDGELISSAYMDIWDQLGREQTDELVLASLNNFFDGMQFEDVARETLMVDLACNGGANCSLIFSVFNQRGMLNGDLTEFCQLDTFANEIEISGTKEFFMNADPMYLRVPESSEKVEVDLFDSNGRLLRSYENDNNAMIILNGWDFLPAGFYFVSVRTEKEQSTQKVMKFR